MPRPALLPVRADEQIVLRRRWNFLRQKFAHDPRDLLALIEHLPELEIQPARKRPAELVVEFIQFGIQPHHALQIEFARPLDHDGFARGNQPLQRRAHRRRDLLLDGETGREDDLILHALAREQLVVVEKIRRKSRANAAHPNALARVRNRRRLALRQVIRLPRIIHRHLLITAFEREQEIAVRRRQSARDVARRVGGIRVVKRIDVLAVLEK